MSNNKIIDDVKTGLKGLKGAGDALRGDMMAAADQALDPGTNNNNKHPQTQDAIRKNKAIAEQGRRDMQAVQERLAAHSEAKQTEVGAGAGTDAGVVGSPGSSSSHANAGNDAGNSTAVADRSGNGREKRGTYRHPMPLP